MQADPKLVTDVHQLTRQLDEDPYTDCFGGVLTSYNAANALRIASHREPLTVRKVASGTEVALKKCEEGLWYCELKKNRMMNHNIILVPNPKTCDPSRKNRAVFTAQPMP